MLNQEQHCDGCNHFCPAPKITEPKLKELGISRGFRSCSVPPGKREGLSTDACITDEFILKEKKQIRPPSQPTDCDMCHTTILLYMKSHEKQANGCPQRPTRSIRVPACGTTGLEVLRNGGSCVRPNKQAALNASSRARYVPTETPLPKTIAQ